MLLMFHPRMLYNTFDHIDSCVECACLSESSQRSDIATTLYQVMTLT